MESTNWALTKKTWPIARTPPQFVATLFFSVVDRTHVAVSEKTSWKNVRIEDPVTQQLEDISFKVASLSVHSKVQTPDSGEAP